VAFAFPQGDPDFEVDFVRPTNTNEGPPEGAGGGGPRFPFPGGFGGGDEEVGRDGFIPVIIVRRVGGGGGREGEGDGGFGLPSGFPFGGSGGGSGGGGLDLRGLLDMFFGGDGGGPGAGFVPTIGDGGDGDVVFDGEGEAPPPPCGLLCTMLTEFQARIDQVEHEIKDIHQKKEDEQNEIGGTGSGSDEEEQDGDDDKYDQTFEEKVLPDGTVVRINRTSFSDTSDDGSSFFFHSTAIHNIGDGTDVDGGEGNNETIDDDVEDEVESLPDVSEDVDSGIDVGLTGEKLTKEAVE